MLLKRPVSFVLMFSTLIRITCTFKCNVLLCVNCEAVHVLRTIKPCQSWRRLTGVWLWRDRLWVRFPLEEIEYLVFSFLRSGVVKLKKNLIGFSKYSRAKRPKEPWVKVAYFLSNFQGITIISRFFLALHYIPHIMVSRGNWETLMETFPFPTFLRILKALFVEWRNSTPHFAPRVTRTKKENLKYCIFLRGIRTHNLLCLQTHGCSPVLRLASNYLFNYIFLRLNVYDSCALHIWISQRLSRSPIGGCITLDTFDLF